ncbi:hypothetical protein, partial [Marinobacter persicus]|uniref:hypothetical protein n=1 Tax=Marinobacter persicus TaxID=930118 RepID=UPI001CA53E86
PRRYAPMGGSLAPVRVAGFTWNGWQPSAVYAALMHYFVGLVDFVASLQSFFRGFRGFRGQKRL